MKTLDGNWMAVLISVAVATLFGYWALQARGCEADDSAAKVEIERSSAAKQEMHTTCVVACLRKGEPEQCARSCTPGSP